jgi:hypothetical protein
VNSGNTIRVTEKALARLHAIQARQSGARGRRVTMAEVIETLLDFWEVWEHVDQEGNPR